MTGSEQAFCADHEWFIRLSTLADSMEADRYPDAELVRSAARHIEELTRLLHANLTSTTSVRTTRRCGGGSSSPCTAPANGKACSMPKRVQDDLDEYLGETTWAFEPDEAAAVAQLVRACIVADSETIRFTEHAERIEVAVDALPASVVEWAQEHGP